MAEPREERTVDQSNNWKPVPDPTVLTTEALRREIAHLREHVDGQADRLEDRIQSAVDHNQQLMQLHTALDNEKFAAIEQRFRDRDLLVNAAFEASREAVAQALAASKEAVSKSETNFAGRLAGVEGVIAASKEGTTNEIGAVRDRLALVEGERGGMSQAVALGLAVTTILIGIAAVIVTVIIANSGT